MKIYSFSEARANLAKLLDEAQREQVVIRRRKGDAFTIVPQTPAVSPFDVPSPVRRKVPAREIVQAIRESRKGRP